MSGKRNFAALRQHASKECKFRQGKSIQALDPHRQAHGVAINDAQLSEDECTDIQGGVCAERFLKQGRGVYIGFTYVDR